MTEHFAKVPVDLLGWMASARLTDTEGAVLAYLLQQTLGYSRGTTERWAGRASICAATGRDPKVVKRALVGLAARHVIRAVGGGGFDAPTEWALCWPIALSGGDSSAPRGRHSPQGSSAPPGVPGAPGEGTPAPPGGGDSSAPTDQSRDQIKDQSREQQQRPREGTVRYGPDPTTGDVELAARTLFARMQRQEAGRPARHPSAVDLERLALILTGPDAARAADVERACGAAGMGFRAFLLCWDDDGALVADRIPSRKAPGERPEPEWAVRRRRLAEALERRREIYAEIDAAGGETVTPEQEVELNEISRLERLGA